MNVNNVDLEDKKVEKLMEHAIQFALDDHLERLDPYAEYDYGIDYEEIKFLVDDIIAKIHDFILEGE